MADGETRKFLAALGCEPERSQKDVKNEGRSDYVNDNKGQNEKFT